MENDFVTLTTCQFEAQAESIRILLEEEGVKAYVADANVVTANYLLGPAVGYIKVQVPRAQAERAAAILREHPRLTERMAEAADESPARCLACGSAMAEDAESCPVCGWTFKVGAAQDEPGSPGGALRYEYSVPYEADVQSALDKLRDRVFASRQFNGAERNPPTPGAAVEMTGASGTRSILDIQRVAGEPDQGCAAPFAAGELQGYFGTDKPTAEMVRQSKEFWENIERGQARYIVLYEGSEPKEIYFAGCSLD